MTYLSSLLTSPLLPGCGSSVAISGGPARYSHGETSRCLLPDIANLPSCPTLTSVSLPRFTSLDCSMTDAPDFTLLISSYSFLLFSACPSCFVPLWLPFQLQLSHRMQAATMCEYTKDEFLTGLRSLGYCLPQIKPIPAAASTSSRLEHIPLFFSTPALASDLCCLLLHPSC